MSNDETYSLDGRVAILVEWLAKQAERVNGADKLKLEFNCAGLDVKAIVTSFEDTITNPN